MRRNGTSQPPAISATPSARYRLRFNAQTGAVVNSTITIRDLYDCVCMGISATNARRVFGAIRLRKIELWGAPVSSSTPTVNTVAIRDLTVSPVGGRDQVISDTHLGADRPAHVSWKPSKGSMASMWLDPGQTTALLSLSCAQGSVLDVTFDGVLGAAPGFVNSLVTATFSGAAGVVYIRALDSNSGAFWPALPQNYNPA